MVAGFGAFKEKGKSPKPLRTVAAPDSPEGPVRRLFNQNSLAISQDTFTLQNPELNANVDKCCRNL